MIAEHKYQTQQRIEHALERPGKIKQVTISYIVYTHNEGQPYRGDIQEKAGSPPQHTISQKSFISSSYLM